MRGSHTRMFIYLTAGILFIICVIGMLYYGYKTFYIEKNVAPSDEYAYHFALIGEETENDYWKRVEKGAREAAAEEDIYLEYVAPQKADNESALKLLDRMISSNVDGIITQGIEGQRFKDLVHKGNEKNLPIVAIDADIPESGRKAYVGSNNVDAGKRAGQAISNNTTGEQYVGIVMGRFDAINQQERIDGLKSEIDQHPRIHLVAKEKSDITETGAAQATYSLLKEHPEITALIGISALDGIGIVDGLHKIAPHKSIYIIGFGLLPETRALIQEDKINATIAQYPEKMGYNAVKIMVKLQGKTVLDKERFIDTDIIKKEDLPPSRGDDE